jgi:hypothetical protein
MARSPTAAETKSASCAAVPTFDSRDPFPHAERGEQRIADVPAPFHRWRLLCRFGPARRRTTFRLIPMPACFRSANVVRRVLRALVELLHVWCSSQSSMALVRAAGHRRSPPSRRTTDSSSGSRIPAAAFDRISRSSFSCRFSFRSWRSCSRHGSSPSAPGPPALRDGKPVMYGPEGAE